MLEAAGFRTHLGGNVGNALVARLEDIEPGDRVALLGIGSGLVVEAGQDDPVLFGDKEDGPLEAEIVHAELDGGDQAGEAVPELETRKGRRERVLDRSRTIGLDDPGVEEEELYRTAYVAYVRGDYANAIGNFMSYGSIFPEYIDVGWI